MGIMKVQILCAFTIIVLLQQASQALSEASIQRQLYCDEEWKDDGYCDDENNHEACDFDGGDCCNNEQYDWDLYCDDCECLEPQPCATTTGELCILPFKHKGKTHMTCKPENGKTWCSTKVNNNGVHMAGNWGYCNDKCPK